MKRMLGICVALAFAQPVATANAFTIENVSVSETGSISSSEEVNVSGSSDASASVRSIIRARESGAGSVRVDIQTNMDGTSYATSVARMFQPGERIEVRIATSTRDTSRSSALVLVEGSASAISLKWPESPRVPNWDVPMLGTSSETWSGRNLFSRLEGVFSALFRHLLDFGWQI